MKATAKQIERAKARYNAFMQYRTVESFEPEYIGWAAAEQRAEAHNNIVREIANGNRNIEREWKTFILNEILKSDRKAEESKAKLQANKEASADVLAPVKKLRKLGDFGKWLNTSGNPYRKQHFNKSYTNDAVNAYLATI